MEATKRKVGQSKVTLNLLAAGVATATSMLLYRYLPE